MKSKAAFAEEKRIESERTDIQKSQFK